MENQTTKEKTLSKNQILERLLELGDNYKIKDKSKKREQISLFSGIQSDYSALTKKYKDRIPELEIDKLINRVLEAYSLVIKYDKFDLEATRRENMYLRQLLENKDR